MEFIEGQALKRMFGVKKKKQNSLSLVVHREDMV